MGGSPYRYVPYLIYVRFFNTFLDSFTLSVVHVPITTCHVA